MTRHDAPPPRPWLDRIALAFMGIVAAWVGWQMAIALFG